MYLKNVLKKNNTPNMDIIDIFFTDSFLQKIAIGILIFGLINGVYLRSKIPRK